MDGSIRQILDPRILTEAYRQTGVNDATPFTDAFFLNPEPIDDDTFRGMFDPADMAPAPGNVAGAAARVVYLGDAQERIFNMVCSFNMTTFSGNVLRALREPGSYGLQKMGRTEVNRVLVKFRRRQARFKELWLAKTLTQGVVYMNERGQILESSTGAVTTSDYGVAADHKGNLGGLISALFSVAGTDIPSILENIDDQAASDGVTPPSDLWLNKVNLQSLRNNTKFQTWAANNEGPALQVLKGGMIESLWGKNWHFVNTKYTASDGTVKPLIPATGQGSLVLTPPPTEGWVKVANGATEVPKSLNLAGDVEQILSQIDTVYGMFAYAALRHNPVMVDAFIGDKFLLGFNDPEAIWMGTGF